MNTPKHFLGALCATTMLCSAAHAEETTALDMITVTAPEPVSINAIPFDLEANPPSSAYSDGADYLRELPGISIGRFGGHGLEPVIRGQAQNQLNIIAGDSYTFGGCPNRMDPPTSYLDLDSFDEIELVKGYQSVLNGPGGAGGTVILNRSQPLLDETFSISGSITGGHDSNHSMWHSGATILGGDDRGYIRANAGTKHAGNYEDGSGKTVRSAFDENSGGMTIGLTPDTNTHITFGYDYHLAEDALFPGAGMDSPLAEGQTYRLSMEKAYDSGLFKRIEASAYNSLVDHEMDNYSLRTPGAMLRSVDSESDTMGAKFRADLDVDGQQVETLVEYRRNSRNADRYQGMSVSSVNTLQSVMWPDIVADEIGFAAETTFDTSEEGRLIVGGRYDYVIVAYGRADLVAPGSSRSANDLYRQFYGIEAGTQTEHNLGGLLRYEHALHPGLTLFSGISRSVRTADATERGIASYMVMMGNNLSWVGNPNIDPEQHHQLDVGLEAQGTGWSVGTSAYLNRVTDYILRDSARGQNGILVTATGADVYRNIDALLAGLELQGSWDISSSVTLRGDATYTYGENLDDDMALAQIPPLQGTLGVQWQAYETLSLGTDMRWAMTQTRVDTNTATGTGRDVGRTSGYAVFDVSATLTELEPVSLTLGVSNLFDQDYANHLNRSNISDPTEVQVNEPGRSFYIQARMPF